MMSLGAHQRDYLIYSENLMPQPSRRTAVAALFALVAPILPALMIASGPTTAQAEAPADGTSTLSAGPFATATSVSDARGDSRGGAAPSAETEAFIRSEMVEPGEALGAPGPEATNGLENVIPGGDALAQGFNARGVPLDAPSPRATTLANAVGDPAGQWKVLVIYSPQAAARAGGAGPLVSRVNTQLSWSNGAFTRSQVPAQITTVGVIPGATQAPTLAGKDPMESELLRLRDRDGYYDDLQALRLQHRADQITRVVSLPTSNSCGIAWLRPVPENSTSVVDVDCLDQRTLTHELAHNLGAGHEAANGVGVYPYAAGLVGPTKTWRTIMAYPNTCANGANASCPRIQNFSNPAVFNGGYATGTASANNAKVLRDYAATFASYTPNVIYPAQIAGGGSLQWKGRGLSLYSGWWLPRDANLNPQWLINGVPVPGATGPTYHPRRSDIGKRISARVTGTSPTYTPVSTMSPTWVVQKASMKSGRSRLTGSARVGGTLRINLSKQLRNRKGLKKKVTWYRNGKKIKGAKKLTYRVQRKDRGKRLSVKVKVSHRHYLGGTIKWRPFRIR